MITANLKASLFEADMNLALLWAVEIQHDDITETLYLINDSQSHIIGPIEYMAMPFDVTFDPDDQAGDARIQIRFSNVDQTLGDFFRGLTTPATATVKIISSVDTATVQASWPTLRCMNVVQTREVLAVSFVTHQLSSAKFPPHSFTPDVFPGAFR